MPQRCASTLARFVAGTALCMACVAAAPSLAATVRIGPGQDLQQAIDAAAPGDTVVLGAGHYSANLRIIEAICNETGFPIEKTLESIVDFGNTSSATIPLALCKAVRAGKVKAGDKIMLFGFGGGLAYSGTVVTWG